MRIFLVMLALLLVQIAPAFAQSPGTTDAFIAQQNVLALRDLSSVAVIYRFKTKTEVITGTEWLNLIQVALARDVPKLKVHISPGSAHAWLEFTLITAESGGAVRMTLRRWANIPAESHRFVFSPVWTDTQLISGHPSREVLRQSVDTLLTEFGSDYLRAKGSPDRGSP